MSSSGFRAPGLLRSVATSLLALIAPLLLPEVTSAGSPPREQLDAQGRAVLDSSGARKFYESTDQAARTGRGRRTGPAGPLAARAVGVDPDAVRLAWYRAAYGTGIGFAGMAIADLDGDGVQELVASATSAGFGANEYWYVLERDGAGYRQRFTSLPSEVELERLIVGQLDDDEPLEILIAADGHLLVYDGFTFEVEADLSTPADWIEGIAAADLDSDPAVEVAFCDQFDAWIFDLETGTQQLALPGRGCRDLAIGETDGTAGLEIVIAEVGEGWVLDGTTGAVEWDHPLGFGIRVVLGDLDGDGLDEIASAPSDSTIQVWHGDSHAFAWEVFAGEMAAMLIADVDGIGAAELLYGEGQWGSLHVLDGTDGDELWFVENPEHGMTRIAVGDVGDDGAVEIYFGSGFSSTGPDHLYVVDPVSHEIVWESEDFSGPFFGLAHGDIDADGVPELLYTSFVSDSGYGDGRYFVHDARRRSLEYSSPVPPSGNGGEIRDGLAVNIDDDPALEVLLSTDGWGAGEISCFDGQSHLEEWSAELFQNLEPSALRSADPDGDSNLEIAAGTGILYASDPGPFVLLFDAASGDPEWQSPSLFSFFGYGLLDLLRVADFDDDGHGELIVSSRGAGLLALDSVAGTIDLGEDELEVTALETVDLGGDGIPEIVIGTQSGLIQSVHPVSGVPTTLAGPYGGAIDGLAVVDLIGDGVKDYVFAVDDRLHLVDGGTLQLEWTSLDLGDGVGASDSLLVADLDEDGDSEIWVNTGVIGHMIFSLNSLPFADGFETADTDAWSIAQP